MTGKKRVVFCNTQDLWFMYLVCGRLLKAGHLAEHELGRLDVIFLKCQENRTLVWRKTNTNQHL